MRSPRRAVHLRRAAYLVGINLLVLPAPVALRAQASRGVIEQLAQEASQLVEERYVRALGRVAERRRDKVFVLLRQAPPPPGTVLEVVRAAKPREAERVVARIEVVQTEAGITECREKERTGRAHSEQGDTVRRPVGTMRVLLAPCVALVDIAPEIPEVIGEKLRESLRQSVVGIVDNPETERRAEAAYLSSRASEFVARQTTVDEVLYPVLMQAAGKMVLNLEYYSVARGRATDIDVVSAPIDDLMRAWLRAGRSQRGAPLGFRRLAPQLHPWRVVGLGEGPPGTILVADSDSIHVFAFDHPGLRLRDGASLGPLQRRRRDPWCVLLPMHAAGEASRSPGVYVLSDERKPIVITWPRGGTGALHVRPAGNDLDAVLERAWSGRKQDGRWWPAPGQIPDAIQPVFADIDQDGRNDLAWSDRAGVLHVKLATQRSGRTYPGFGDVKAVLVGKGTGGRALFWLTDPVWHGDPDRLHLAEISGDDLQVHWSSEPFEGTIVALAGVDLDGDGTQDLVAAESLADGTRLHTFMTFAGADRNAPVPSDAGAER